MKLLKTVNSLCTPAQIYLILSVAEGDLIISFLYLFLFLFYEDV